MFDSSANNVLSIRETFAGKHVLLTGASGFVGKVWLTMMLEHVPEVGSIRVLLRRKALLSARERFEKMVNGSPAFGPLHERFGAGFSSYLMSKVQLLDGDISEPNLGLSAGENATLRRELDLIVHCAGLVDFDPDVRKALSANVDGTMNVADLAASSDHAALLHISTCYVAGRRYGRIAEEVQPDFAPIANNFDAAREIEQARAAIDRICAEHDKTEHIAKLRLDAEANVSAKGAVDRARAVNGELRRLQRESLRQALSDEGTSRAARLGWPNTYTYTKSLAESLLLKRAHELRLAILRPSIVESSVQYPFPGWNESFNGSAPLAYVMGTWFRAIPARPGAPFDVIPVDHVAQAMTNVSALLLQGRAQLAYHVGSSDRNACSVGRAAELIVLAHRQYYRSSARTRTERLWKSRSDSVLVEPDDPYCVQNARSITQGFLEAIDLLPTKLVRKLQRLRNNTLDVDDRLASIEKLVGLYLPFMYDGHYVFEANGLRGVLTLEPEWRFEPERLDWRRYWLETHMPGLRRWAFPLIEGKRPERHKPLHPVKLSVPPPVLVGHEPAVSSLLSATPTASRLSS
jgi:long-chain acyl-CoA synthetase